MFKKNDSRTTKRLIILVVVAGGMSVLILNVPQQYEWLKFSLLLLPVLVLITVFFSSRS